MALYENSNGKRAGMNKSPMGLISSAPIQIHNSSRRKSTVEGSIYTFRQLFTPPKTHEPNSVFQSSSPETSNRYHDRFDMLHLFDRRHSMDSLTYSRSMNFNGVVSSSPAELNPRSRSNSVTEGGYTESGTVETEEEYLYKKDPMKHMMLKGQLMDF